MKVIAFRLNLIGESRRRKNSLPFTQKIFFTGSVRVVYKATDELYFLASTKKSNCI